METLSIPSISKNLVSLSKFDKGAYEFKFFSGSFSLYKKNCIIGDGTLRGGLYKVSLDKLYPKTLMTQHYMFILNIVYLVNNLFTYDINICDIFLKKKWKD